MTFTDEQARERLHEALRGYGAYEIPARLAAQVGRALLTLEAENAQLKKACDEIRASWLAAGEESVHWMKRTEEEAKTASALRAQVATLEQESANKTATVEALNERIETLEARIHELELRVSSHADAEASLDRKLADALRLLAEKDKAL